MPKVMHSTAEFFFLSLLGLKIARGEQNVVILFVRQPGTGIEGNEVDTEAKTAAKGWREHNASKFFSTPPPPRSHSHHRNQSMLQK